MATSIESRTGRGLGLRPVDRPRSEREPGGGGGGGRPPGKGVRFGVVAAVVAMVGAAMFGCSAVQSIPDREERAFLEVRVEPPSTEIYVDGEYRGTVEGWVEGAVPVEPGEHRVKLRAERYITRRFDVEFEAGESKVLELEMELRLDRYANDAGRESGREQRGRPGAGRPRSPLETDPSVPGVGRRGDASGSGSGTQP